MREGRVPEQQREFERARRFTGRAVDYGAFRPIPELIREQADRHPERPAVTYDGRTLTYRRLDELVNGLAAVLAERGVRRGDVVPVLLVNGLEMPVTYLALMDLGAAFVPLDPAWPADRLRSAFGVLPDGPVPCADPETLPAEIRDRVAGPCRWGPTTLSTATSPRARRARRSAR
jgi:non-ribosomal peptide synthetase component F